jgi:transcriptional regulator of arginine metabolism
VSAPLGTVARREAILELIRRSRVGTQEELRDRLKERGFRVTQATLSRDLARLGARRVTLPAGGTTYEIDSLRGEEQEKLGYFRPLVTSVEESHAMVVVMTEPAAASTIARAIDRERLPEVLATLAGDDTVFVVPKRRSSPQALARRLRGTWKKGRPS